MVPCELSLAGSATDLHQHLPWVPDLPTLVSPAAQGLILLVLLFFQNHSELSQALTKEAR